MVAIHMVLGVLGGLFAGTSVLLGTEASLWLAIAAGVAASNVVCLLSAVSAVTISAPNPTLGRVGVGQALPRGR